MINEKPAPHAWRKKDMGTKDRDGAYLLAFLTTSCAHLAKHPKPVLLLISILLVLTITAFIGASWLPCP